MSICYKCDACGAVMPDRHRARMKEFYFGTVNDNGYKKKIDLSHKIKVDLCDDCYHGLYEIAKGKSN